MQVRSFLNKAVWVLWLTLLSVSYGLGQGRPTSSFKWATYRDCPIPNADTAYLRKMNVVYGYLTVPENRLKDNGRTLRLSVSVIKSSEPTAALAPLVILHGGPGGRIVGSYSRVYDLLRKERDIVLIDQRGSGFSGPELAPEMNQAIL